MSKGPHLSLGQGAEFDHIRAIWARLGRRMVSSGDDCAIVPVGPTSLAVSSDLSVEGTHFRRGWMSPFEIGFRAATAAFSDLAAVAATPLGVQVAIGASAELHDDVLPDLMLGVGEAASRLRARVWGGDLVRSENMVIDVTVVGRIDGEPVRRSGASPGDLLFVTGWLGGPAAALRSWEAGVEPEAWCRNRFVAPAARTVEGQWLLGHGARAMIDLSDGLLADAGHLAVASGVAAAVNLETVPCGGGIAPREAVVGGEEYELLCAVPPAAAGHLPVDFARIFGLPLTCVGECRAGQGVQLLEDGVPVEIPDGFRHF